MKLQESIASFLLAKEANTKASTVRHYKSHLPTIKRYFESVGIDDLDNLSKNQVNRFIIAQRNANIKDKTINHRVSIIKQLIKENYTEQEMTREHKLILKNIKFQKTEPESYMPYSKEEKAKFFEYINGLNPEHKHDLKRMAALLLCNYNGLRSAEVRGIKMSDVMLDRNKIKLSHTKTCQTRYAYLYNPLLLKIMTKYIEVFKPVNYLFENPKTHAMMDVNSVQFYAKHASKVTGCHFSIHRFRTTFCTDMLQSGCPAPDVQIMMGHKHLSTTEMYVHITDDDVAMNYAKYSEAAVNVWKDAEQVSKLNALLDSMMIDSEEVNAKA